MSPRPDGSVPALLASRARGRLARVDRLTVGAALVAVAAGAVTFALAATVFEHHSFNHDEGVYLTQAALLLDGQLAFHAGALADAFRPWFFVQDGGRLYPKYGPVPAAMYAVSMGAFGEPRVTLAAVAAGNAALVYLLGSMSFDRRVGLAAAVLFAASPMAVVTSSVFLPYAPTTFFNLLFAVAYVRSVRDRSTPAAGLAGVAVGLAFFARPYTAVLFAAPFIAHALWRVGSAVAAEGPSLPSPPDPVRRHGLTALLGSLFVGVTLAYNLRVTGTLLTFPYEAFAPTDGPGFGDRRILAHSETYTPTLALESNGYALWYLATRWVAAGPLGAALALAGGALAARRWSDGRRALPAALDSRETARTAPADRRFERTAGALLCGVAVSVVAGNLFFWGTNNLLATFSDPTDGLVSGFGPFYHFDLLVPLSVFGGVAVVAGYEAAGRARAGLASRRSPDAAWTVAAAALVLFGGAAGAAVAVAAPLDGHAAQADKHETAYAPVDETAFDDALVFLPTPYGEWLGHPFQSLRNEPGLDGAAVYALDRDPVEDFAVLDAYPNRNLYRYGYQGEWTPDPDRHVAPKLEPLAVRSGASVAAETAVGVPDRVDRVRLRLETDRGTPDAAGAERATAVVTDPDDSLSVDWSVAPDGARLAAAPDAAVPVAPDGDVVAVTATLVAPDGSTFTYRQEATVRVDGDRVEVVWPPERSVCRLTTECGTAGTYLPDDPDAHAEWVVFETEAEAGEE